MSEGSKIVIFEVAKRPAYELVTAAGDDRPVYVGSSKWYQQQAIPNNRNVYSRFRDWVPF
jgi:hypothetical protein